MPTLTSKIRVIPAPSTLPATDVDIFADALPLLFTDDPRNQHGDQGSTIRYSDARFGDMTLSLPEPRGERERRLFAHYLWNAGVWLAEAVGEEEEEGGGLWNVKGERVLEMGAGLGLAGIVSSLAGAEEVVISDYPAPELLANIAKNVEANVPDSAHMRCRPTVQGHEWGDFTTSFATTYKGYFTRVLAADCLWMVWEHRNLARSMAHFLSTATEGRDRGKVFVVAGFHTGRAKVAAFFETAEEEGLVVESIEEVDIEGSRREWSPIREGEDLGERKRWVVTAMLTKRSAKSEG